MSELIKTKDQIKAMTLQEKLSFITDEIGPIAKTKRPDDTVSFKYRSIDDVQNHLSPLLAEYGITLQSKVLKCDLTTREFEKNGVKKIAYTAVVHLAVIFSDGKDSETWEEVSMSEDYADKAVTQAMSMAYKYSLLRKFCIVTADLTDPDSRQPDYRDSSHDSERSGPKPTKWLDEGTADWENVEEKLRSKEWTLSHVKTLFKVNKRQEATLENMYGKPYPPTAGAAVNPPVAPAVKTPPIQEPSKKELNTEIWKETKRIVSANPEAGALKIALAKNKDAQAFYNSEKKLREGAVSFTTVSGVYTFDKAVEDYLKSIAKIQ